jgi:hypothetical protein
MKTKFEKGFFVIQVILMAVVLALFIANKTPDDWRETFNFERKCKKEIKSGHSSGFFLLKTQLSR